MNYYEQQLSKLSEDGLGVKFMSDNGNTNTLCINEESAQAIMDFLENLYPKTCGGCKYDYMLANFDAETGAPIDSYSPKECYMCSRNATDKFELKEK